MLFKSSVMKMGIKTQLICELAKQYYNIVCAKDSILPSNTVRHWNHNLFQGITETVLTELTMVSLKIDIIFCVPLFQKRKHLFVIQIENFQLKV